MKAKVLTAYILLFAIPLTGIYVQHQVRDRCDTVLEYVQAAADAYPDQRMAECIGPAIDIWKDNGPFFTSFITHEEIDSVTVALVRSKALLYAGDTEGCFDALHEAIEGINMAKNFDRPSIRSIF